MRPIHLLYTLGLLAAAALFITWAMFGVNWEAVAMQVPLPYPPTTVVGWGVVGTIFLLGFIGLAWFIEKASVRPGRPPIGMIRHTNP